MEKKLLFGEIILVAISERCGTNALFWKIIKLVASASRGIVLNSDLLWKAWFSPKGIEHFCLGEIHGAVADLIAVGNRDRHSSINIYILFHWRSEDL